MTKSEREQHEYRSLFTDRRYAEKAWKDFFDRSLKGPAKPMPTQIDPKTGEPVFNSLLDEMAYHNVKARLEADGISREPMQAELIVECNIIASRYNPATFNTILERTAGKVKDEISVTKNEFESLSDEELELLAAHRASQEKETTEEE